MTRLGIHTVVALVAASALLAGCRAEERDRALQFDKGSYQGQHDEGLSPEQLKTLRERADKGH